MITTTPKEEAKELVEEFAETIPPIIYGQLMERDWKSAKACATICIDKIIESMPAYPLANDEHTANSYWRQVKEEIKLL